MKNNTSKQEFSQQPFFSPESHSINVGIAEVTNSISAAIVFNHLFFWLKENKIKDQNQHEDRTWMYDSVATIKKHFSYLSVQQVTDALLLLVKHEYVIKGHFNKNKFDRTSWYAVANEEWLGIKKMFAIQSVDQINTFPRLNQNIPQTKSRYNKDTHNNTHNNKCMSEPAVGLTAFFLEKLKEMNPKIREPNLKSWEKEMGRIITVDNRTEKEIKDVINFIVEQHNNPKKDFTWSKAVASPDKLRKHFAAIWMDMNTKTPTQKKETVDNEKIKRIQENKKWATEMAKKLAKKGIGEDAFKVWNDRVYIRSKKRNLDYTIGYGEIAFSEKVENILRNLGAL